MRNVRRCMRLEAAKYLYDAQHAAATLADFVAGRDFAEYQRNAMLRAAVERQFEIIGEALAQLENANHRCWKRSITAARSLHSAMF